MGIRLRFKPAERAAFTEGTAVEWLDVTRWRTGVIDGPIWVSSGDYQCIPVKDTGPKTATMTPGRIVHPNAGHVRLPLPAPVE